MDSSLLATKLRIPPRTHHLVRRSRLVDALERELPNYKLILISAPAGYGKTTLLAQWARASRFSVAWLSLGEDDNDADRFFRCLLRAWEEVQPGVAQTPLGLLLSATGPDRDAVLSAFLNVAVAAPDPTVFVLDDYHLIRDAAIHQALMFLLDHLPPTIHVVLAGRAEPSLALGRYRARQELLELGAEDLQFRVDESEEFLNRLMGLDLADAEIVPLHARLEGWIAGLQLASLTLRRRRQAADDLVVSGRHRFIADYLSEDVLAHLPDDLRRFLLQTSILDRLCGELCDAVTGRDDGQEMLETLERENLFLVPLDDRRAWFRYHVLFADFLREQLTRRHPGEVTALHRRAAAWYLAHELPDQALDHGVAGDDSELVVDLFGRYGILKLHSGDLKLVARWLDAIPAAWYATQPLLGLFRAILLAFTGQFEASLRSVDDVEERLTLVASAETRWQLAMVTAVRCFMACAQNNLAHAETYAERALQNLREEDFSYRGGIYLALGDSYRLHGRWSEAQTSYLTVLTFTDWPGYRVQAAHAFGALADLELRQGRLQNAAANWRRALAVIEDQAMWGRLPLPVSGWVFIRLGEVLYEWNERAEAWDHLVRGLERSELGGDVRALIAGYVIAARLKLTDGDIAAATAYLERARPLVEQASFSDWTSRFERGRLELWLAQDRLRAAVNWSDEMLRGDALQGRPESEVSQLALAHVLIVKGDVLSRQRALALLDRLLQVAEAEDRLGMLIEALALRALAYWQAGARPEAMTALERALRLAEPEGYVRLFADFGPPMARLLQEIRSRGVMPDYVGRLLAAYGGDASPSAGDGTLPEPLSQREQEVLRLIAAGLTNREIAEVLAISPETVKRHTSSIYGKLGVGRRTEAVARARALDVLD